MCNMVTKKCQDVDECTDPRNPHHCPSTSLIILYIPHFNNSTAIELHPFFFGYRHIAEANVLIISWSTKHFSVWMRINKRLLKCSNAQAGEKQNYSMRNPHLLCQFCRWEKNTNDKIILCFCFSLLHLCQSSSSLSVFVSFRQSSPVFASLRQSSSVFVSLRQSSSVFVSFRQSSSVFVSILQSSSVFVSLPQAFGACFIFFYCRFLFVPLWHRVP